MGCVLNLFSSTLSKYHLTSRNPTKKSKQCKKLPWQLQKISMRVIKMSNKIVLFFCFFRKNDRLKRILYTGCSQKNLRYFFYHFVTFCTI